MLRWSAVFYLAINKLGYLRVIISNDRQVRIFVGYVRKNASIQLCMISTAIVDNQKNRVKIDLNKEPEKQKKMMVLLIRNIDLKKVEEGPGKPQPPVLVLNGHYGGCVGDLPSYDAFALGGPSCVRGYTMCELGAARNILVVGAEIRVPVKKAKVYAFSEHGTDLGSSKDVKGNPTAVYRRKGHGSSYGVGVKLGSVRAEYAVDHNCGTGSLSFRFGERY